MSRTAEVNESTRLGLESTILSPRFYTTDFEAMDKLDVGAVRREWDGADRGTARRSERGPLHPQRRVRCRPRRHGPPSCSKEFLEFLVSSVTAEFSGCVLYAEIKTRIKNPDIKELFAYMARDEARHAGFINDTLQGFRRRRRSRLSDEGQEIHVFPAEVHLLRDLPVREDRLCPLHHHLPPARAPSRAALPPDLQVVREVVQRRVPPRRGVRAADARQPESAERHQQALDAVLPAGGLRDDVCARPRAARRSTRRSVSTRPTTTCRCSASPRRSAGRCSRSSSTSTTRVPVLASTSFAHINDGHPGGARQAAVSAAPSSAPR